MASKKKFSGGSSSKSAYKGKNDEDFITFTMDQIKNMTNDFRSRCGEGTHGDVFKGEFTDSNYFDHKVAVKRIDLANKKLLTPPEEEVEVLKKFRHSRHIIKVMGDSKDSEFYCIVMKYVPKTLELVAKTEELSWSHTVRILTQLAYGVKDIIAENFVNGDIKPNNVLIDDNYNAYICDFGSARYGGRNLPTVNDTYAPKECGKGGHADLQKSDLYSLGVIILQMIMKCNTFGKLRVLADLYTEVASESAKQKNKSAWNSSSIMPHLSIQARVEKAKLKEHVVDKSLIASGCTKEDAKTITQLGINCTEQHVNARPSIDEVIAILEGLKF